MIFLGYFPPEVSLFSMHFYMDVFVCSCKMECQSDLLGWFPSEVSLSQCILYCCSLFVLVQVQLANELYTQLQYTWLEEFIRIALLAPKELYT